jgi:hypothetical protein
MAKNGLYSVKDVTALIASGNILLVAGDEALLTQLPAGNWIGGTAVSFMTEDGGMTNRDRIFVHDLTGIATKATIKRYSADDLAGIGADYPASGFSVVIVPGGSDVHRRFAKEVQSYEGVFNSPLLGWIAAVDVTDIGKRQPKVFAGTPDPIAGDAVVLHAELQPGKMAVLDIINPFRPGNGDTIVFDQEGFSCTGDCRIADQPANLARYIRENAIDTKLPLIADYNGAHINVSIQSVDDETGTVRFYAPVFPGIAYRFAEPIADYVEAFENAGNTGADGLAFSCNCILNYMYAELEGEMTGNFDGPITFGEIAYMLLNQTVVYLKIIDVG